jgi:chromosome segregation ATPase
VRGTLGLGIGSTSTALGGSTRCCREDEKLLRDLNTRIDKLNTEIKKQQLEIEDLKRRLDALDIRLLTLMETMRVVEDAIAILDKNYD